jgi:hypothetical protein
MNVFGSSADTPILIELSSGGGIVAAVLGLAPPSPDGDVPRLAVAAVGLDVAAGVALPQATSTMLKSSDGTAMVRRDLPII